MTDISSYKKSLSEDYAVENSLSRLSNPLSVEYMNDKTALNNYSQEVPRPKYDKDIEEIAETVRILNNMAPKKMPEYNFNCEEINGERYTSISFKKWKHLAIGITNSNNDCIEFFL